MECQVHGFEAIQGRIARTAVLRGALPPGRPLQAKLRRKIEYKGKVGPGRTDDGGIKDIDDRKRKAASSALISARGIAEEVAYDPVAPLKRWPDGKLQMRLARGIE